MSITDIKRALIVVDVQNETIDASKSAGIPVVAVQHFFPSTFPVFAPDTHGVELHPVVTSRGYDHLVKKGKASSFVDTDLKEYLLSKGVNTITIVGYMTHNCNTATALQAAHEGLFNVEFISDASGSLPYSNSAGSATAEEIHRAFTVVLHSAFAAVITTDQWLSLVSSKQAAKPGNIVESYMQGMALASGSRK
ncbi:hypothetical protein SAMD00019534_075660 [Acytostelium subglobosum LB1]|uniref:hypothetical protein n=1 Tax=Acytostelium subglobosum LB1 TaxID=1410327 RepID=UPI000644FBC2|nr:hypothetical protein SAMD00019534_075660 [Acytostelium subglobosum LB1]GAM24391.1 hypothetical protein SAMD00019534_075660 [Acytostelium subglobosum LB1]|eukprot:XP_012752717.1 hypothetical protein SAMD00019534_075660 [Acytostelium subglobosum LB1]